MSEEKKIYSLIGEAMRKIGAIEKTSKNDKQGWKYRGIDAVYNSLNPVMSDLGLFICPEILDEKREERRTSNGGVLIYTVLTMRYTVYAPDGSSVSLTVVGEGMDSGDKSSNKAMSVAMKYAMFQLFFIPTEELKDPDAETMEGVLPQTINKNEAAVLKNMLGSDYNESIVLEKYNIQSLEDLTPAQYVNVVTSLRKGKK